MAFIAQPYKGCYNDVFISTFKNAFKDRCEGILQCQSIEKNTIRLERWQ